MQGFLKIVLDWFLSHGISVILIIIGAWVVRKIVSGAISKFQARFKAEGIAPSEEEKRAQTLGTVLRTTLSVLIYAVAIMMIATEFGFSIAPLIAGAGIGALAIGFGAQTLVKDFINGFIILLENQIRVGDVVQVAGNAGLVESVNLRYTRLRDLEGRVHIIPNGSIEVATNFTREWSRALMDIGVAYKEDVDRVISVLNEVAENLRKDPVFSQYILEPLTVLGLDSFGDSSVNMKIYFKTLPLKQWDVAREYRKRVKKAFDEKGIELPFPHRTVYIGKAETPASLKVEALVSSATVKK
ncbi:MAG: mechanosensitive ion channel family protein [candidate division Zixibacteria bacterium]|nr:mechanosensitive ion channel family protein [candidate division Zixibacteria bacterium]